MLEGEKLFSTLQALSEEEVSRSEFFDGKEWDIEGLKDDIRISRGISEMEGHSKPHASTFGKIGQELICVLVLVFAVVSQTDSLSSFGATKPDTAQASTTTTDDVAGILDGFFAEGDALLDDDQCDEALLKYQRAQDAIDGTSLVDEWWGVVAWKVYQARYCLGTVSLALPGSAVKEQKGQGEERTKRRDRPCPSILQDIVLMAELERCSSVRCGAPKMVAPSLNWPKWFSVFGVTAENCTLPLIKRAYRKQMLEYHPDKAKLESNAHIPEICRAQMILLLNAGADNIKRYSNCGMDASNQGRREGEGRESKTGGVDGGTKAKDKAKNEKKASKEKAKRAKAKREKAKREKAKAQKKKKAKTGGRAQ
jgi:hypothetical protein